LADQLACFSAQRTMGCSESKVAAADMPEGDVPPSCKAIFQILQTAAGPDTAPANPKLKMLLTSAGLMPTSAPELLERYAQLAAATPGTGVLYLLDAKLKTLQWASCASDPVKDADSKYVTYTREPEAPGGVPVRAADGSVVPKSQAELAKYGYHSVEYAFFQNHHYSNGHLEIVAPPSADGAAVPVFLSYLGYDTDTAEHTILLARGCFKDGKFSLEKADGSGAFEEADFSAPAAYSHLGSPAFKPVSDAEFAKVVGSVQTVWSCGGVTWLTVMHLQPKKVDDRKVLDVPNPYGKTILDAVKAGEVVYVGQSAGSVAMSHNIGPLTTDPQEVELEQDGDDEAEYIDLAAELGSKMLEPGLGAYVGIPHRMIFRPHLTFQPAKVGYAGKARSTKALAAKLTNGNGPAPAHDVYCAVTADYNFKRGQGDVVEIADGKVVYHVGYCDETIELPPAGKAVLDKLHPAWGKTHSAAFRKQPPGNAPSGRAFAWEPNDGEVCAAGPGVAQPFHIAADGDGPLVAMPPYTDGSVVA